MDYIREHIEETINVKTQILVDVELLEMVNTAAEVIVEAYKNGKKVILAGNGGSAADSEALKASKVPYKWSDNDLNLVDYFL